MVQCLGMPRESLLQFRGKFGLVMVWDDTYSGLNVHVIPELCFLLPHTFYLLTMIYVHTYLSRH